MKKQNVWNQNSSRRPRRKFATETAENKFTTRFEQDTPKRGKTDSSPSDEDFDFQEEEKRNREGEFHLLWNS